MLDWIREYFEDLNDSILGWFKSALEWAYQHVVDAVIAAWDQFSEMVLWIRETAADVIMAALVGAGFEPSAVQSALHGMGSVYDGLAWIFPLNECGAIIAATYTACFAVRLIRWGIGFIPWSIGS